MAAIEDFLADAKRRMDRSIEATHQEFNSIRTGRASPALLDRISIDYYGTPTPLKSLATIGAPEPRMLTVQPFDPSSLKTIERAIQASPNAGKASLRARRVPANALGGLQGARVAFVTAGTNYRAVAAAAAPRSILTISGDPGCVQAGQCVVAINSVPKVQILVSKAATRASNLKFGSAFLMLVKEI